MIGSLIVMTADPNGQDPKGTKSTLKIHIFHALPRASSPLLSFPTAMEMVNVKKAKADKANSRQ